MLLELKNNQVLLNEVPKLKDFKINIVDKKFRSKFTILKEGTEKKVDLVVVHIGLPSFTNHSLRLVGREYEQDILFDLEIKVHIINKYFQIMGNINNEEVNVIASSRSELIEKILNLLGGK